MPTKYSTERSNTRLASARDSTAARLAGVIMFKVPISSWGPQGLVPTRGDWAASGATVEAATAPARTNLITVVMVCSFLTVFETNCV